MIDRSTREQQASDESGCYDNWAALYGRYRHIFASPNMRRYRQTLDDLLRQEAAGKRILEIGCGIGEIAHNMASYGATSVLGTDISHRFIAEADARYRTANCMYAVLDVSQLIEGTYDLIVGRAVLHH